MSTYVPYLPNQTGRYEIPTPRANSFPRGREPQGEEFTHGVGILYPPHPIG